MQYEKNKIVIHILAPIPIKYLPEGKIFLSSLIDHSIKEDDCSDACNFFSFHCSNGSSHIQGIYFDQSYSQVAHSDSFIINITIVDMHRLTANILDAINSFHNTNFPIPEIVCVSTQP